MHDDIYPYAVDPDYHPLTNAIFKAGGTQHDIDTCHAIAKHIFDDLGCGAPGTAHEPKVKYDALGSSGAPWEPGVWIPVEEARASVVATAPDKDITAMTPEERAELKAALEAAEAAERAGATNRQIDESKEG